MTVKLNTQVYIIISVFHVLNRFKKKHSERMVLENITKMLRVYDQLHAYDIILFPSKKQGLQLSYLIRLLSRIRTNSKC